MNNRGEMDYYLGLDIGTESIGWAVTDENYNILKFNGKNMWGSRLFDEALTAAERRTFRTGRRRIQEKNGEYNFFRIYFQRKLQKLTAHFI